MVHPDTVVVAAKLIVPPGATLPVSGVKFNVQVQGGTVGGGGDVGVIIEVTVGIGVGVTILKVQEVAGPAHPYTLGFKGSG